MNRTLTTLTLTCLTLLALTAAAPTASAEPITVGDCQKFSGGCASVCVEGAADCGGDRLLCFGISYQLPFCLRA